MPRRSILTKRQQARLLDLPTDAASLHERYTLDDFDLEQIRDRRRAHNKMGFALQLCALRYPGRLLALGEIIPSEVLDQAFHAPSNLDLAERFIGWCRETQTILPGISTIERLCAEMLVKAERQIDAAIADKIDPKMRQRLDVLLDDMVTDQLTRFCLVAPI